MIRPLPSCLSLLLLGLSLSLPAHAWDLEDLDSAELQAAAQKALRALGPERGAVSIEPVVPLAVVGFRQERSASGGLVVDYQQELLDLKASRLGAERIDAGYRFVLPTRSSAIESLHQEPQGETSRLAAFILEAAPFQVIINGHTSSSGKRTLNLIESRHQAQIMADALIRQGVAPRILRTGGLGASQPLYPNRLPDGSPDPVAQARNQRIEVIVELNPQPRTIRARPIVIR